MSLAGSNGKSGAAASREISLACQQTMQARIRVRDRHGSCPETNGHYYRHLAMIFPSRSQLASKQITRTGRAEAVTKEGLAATLLPARQPDRMGQRHPLRPVRPRSRPGPLRNGSLCCISTRMWALPFFAKDQELVADELAAAADEDRWAAGQACPLLLAAAGRGASEPQAVRATCCRGSGRCLCREGNADGPDSQCTRVAEDRRGRGVAKKPSAVAGTARSGRFEGRSGSERSTERGSSAKTVAARRGSPARDHRDSHGDPGKRNTPMTPPERICG